MKEERSFLDRVQAMLPLLVFILLLVQPILDVAGYWQQELGLSNTGTLLIRMALLAASVLLGFLLSDRKKYYLVLLLVCVLLTLGHAYACVHTANGYREAVKDIVNLVRIYFLPLMTFCFMTFLQKNDKVFSTMVKAVVLDVAIIASVQLISTLTGTDPHTYADDKIGVRGWFLWTNSQSAVLAMACPIVICWATFRWKNKLLPLILTALIAEGALFVLAPRLAYAALIGVGFAMAFCLLLLNRKFWPQTMALVLVTCLFVALYPVSPTYQRLNVNESNVEKTKEKIEQMDIHVEIVADSDTDSESFENPNSENGERPTKPVVRLDKENAEKLEKIYFSQVLLRSMAERFGRDQVFHIYNYTLDPTVLSSARQIKINFCALLMEESGVLSKCFGLNLKDMTHERIAYDNLPVTDNYDVENDFHGMYFLTGYVGLGLMIVFLIWFGLRALIAVIRKPKQFFNLPMCAFALAYGVGLIHAYFTASVLRRNNASIYMAFVLAGLWYLSQTRESSPQKSRTGSAVTSEERGEFQ